MDDFNRYSPRFKLVDGCLTEIHMTRSGPAERKLCNFAPYLTEEITLDDGVETSSRIKLRGTHQNGRELPEIEIAGSDLPAFNWLPDHWGMDCILEVGKNIKELVRYAIQTTADHAERKTVYTVTGWKKIEGQWEFLLPGDDAHTVKLPGKLHGFRAEAKASAEELSLLRMLLTNGPAEKEILLPLLALTFLSPLNHFLAQAECEPKFVLFLIGKTGSRKSTLAALMLSFFGRFTATELPMSFQDTAYSILYHAFSLKDVLTCVDDFHPASRFEEAKLTATAQTVLRAYGDRVGRGRLRPDVTPMEARPPQGNAIVTAEFPPDIGESGTARYFALEMNAGSVDLNRLSFFQAQAAQGVLARCMRSYLEWLRGVFLRREESEKSFLFLLKDSFQSYRDEFRASGIACHGRVAETVAWLRIGMDYLLRFLLDANVLGQAEATQLGNEHEALLYQLAAKQAESIAEDRPTQKFLRKLHALLEAGQVCLLPKDSCEEYPPSNCVGREDDTYWYLFGDIAHKAVREWCERQGESFSVSCKGLLKALAEEGYLEPAQGQNTRAVRLGGKPKRVACLWKDKIRTVTEAGLSTDNV